MKIAIDVSPLQSGHKVRGIGFYVEHLKSSLIKYSSENEYIFFNAGEKIPKDTELVHFPYFEPFFLELPLYKRFKTVVTVHDLTPIVFPKAFPKGFKGQLKWQMQKFSLKKTNGIITDSINSKKDVIKYIGVKNDLVSVVYLAAGEEFKRFKTEDLRLKTVREKFSLPENFALYVGDVTWNKNLPRLIDAIKTTNIPLVMIGKSLVNENYDKTNPWNSDLVRVQELSRDDKNIIKLGFVDSLDLVSIYNMATVFVMPSLYEGFGLPILEAQACGLPVVTTNQGSLKEVAGHSAFIVDGYDMKSIASGIKKVFENKSLQEELAKLGLENAKKYSWKKTAAKTIEAYKKAIS